MTPRTYEYEVSLAATPLDAMVEAGGRVALSVSTPPELGGAPDRWTPEHLLLASLSSCFWTTYQALARRRGLEVRRLTCRANATVAKSNRGLVLVDTRLAVDVDVNPADFALARALLRDAEERCLISRSLKVPTVVEAVVTSTSRLAEASPPEA
jgi:organic hydroperoxide reductase OsmC/OhrA